MMQHKRYLFSIIIVVAFFTGCKKDKEVLHYIQFENTAASVSEATAADVKIKAFLATQQLSSSVTVTYTLGGTAVQGTHFTITSSGILTIPANTSVAEITLRTIDNQLQDGNKTIVFTINKAEANGKALPLGTLNLRHTLTIADDECSPYIKATWNYRARYWSYLGATEIPANQAGQGLATGQDPYFAGTVAITDPTNTRAYTLSDVIVGQFAGLGVATAGSLLDACSNLSYSTIAPPLFFGVYPVKLTSGKIVSADSISLNWTVFADPAFTTPVFRGEAGLKK